MAESAVKLIVVETHEDIAHITRGDHAAKINLKVLLRATRKLQPEFRPGRIKCHSRVHVPEIFFRDQPEVSLLDVTVCERIVAMTVWTKHTADITTLL